MKYTIAGCILFLMSCGDIKVKPDVTSGKDSVVQKNAVNTPASVKLPSANKDTVKTLTLQTFNDISEEISGCSGLYKSRKCQGACDYILATDLQGKAFIKVDGNLISLRRTNNSVTDKKTKERYEGEGFIITIEVYPRNKTGDEVREYYGELIVVKGDLKHSESITGEVGC